MKLLTDDIAGRSKWLRHRIIGRQGIAYIITIVIGMCILQSYATKDEPIDKTKPAQSPTNSQILFDDSRPLHPGVFELFLGWISDKDQVITSMSLTGISHSNRFVDPFQQKLSKDGRRWYSKKIHKEREGGSEEKFSYSYVGRLATGHHVIMTAWMSGGSGTFYSLMFIKKAETKLLDFTNIGSVRSKTTPSIVCEGSYPLGDRFRGSVQIQEGCIRIVGRAINNDEQTILIRFTGK